MAWKVEVVQIGKVGKHPNADNLSITTVHGHPVIFTTGHHHTGDLAVHVPVDSVVDTSKHPFEWLGNGELKRVEVKKIRGIPSYGFLVGVYSQKDQPGVHALNIGDEWELVQPGQEVSGLLGIKKWEPGPKTGKTTQANGPNLVVPHYDIQHHAKYSHVYEPEQSVIITEKIHGTNARFVFHDGKLHVGTRNTWLKVPAMDGSIPPGAMDPWNAVAKLNEFDATLRRFPDLVLFGEIYGAGIQDLAYGRSPGSQPAFALFDVYDPNKGKYLNWLEMTHLGDLLGLKRPPVLYVGRLDWSSPSELAEGLTAVGGGHTHVREGVVIRPTWERWHPDLGRVITKIHGQGFLTRKLPKLDTQDIINGFLPEPKVEPLRVGPKPTSNIWTRVVNKVKEWL